MPLEIYYLWGIVTCPMCLGAGETDVGLMGFDLKWRGKCPECDGSGKVSSADHAVIEKRKNKLREQSRPLPPSGLF